jgi:hypothetical protein
LVGDGHGDPHRRPCGDASPDADSDAAAHPATDPPPDAAAIAVAAPAQRAASQPGSAERAGNPAIGRTLYPERIAAGDAFTTGDGRAGDGLGP